MQIRRAGDDDQETVAALRGAFLRDVTGTDELTSAFEQELADFFATEHRAGRVWTWLAESDDGRSVGVVSLLLRPVPPNPQHRGTLEGYVINLYVAPEARRTGAGRALMAALMDEAEAAGLRKVALNAREAGRPLYESMGFTPDPRYLERWLG